MATTAMSTYTRRIALQEGLPWGRIPVRVNGSDEVYPGFVITNDGHTWPDVGKPDAIYERPLAIADCEADHDIDLVYADDAEIGAYLLNSQAVVFVYKKGGAGGGSVKYDDIMCSDGTANTGFVRPLYKALAGSATYASFMLTIVGRARETLASAAANTPMMIQLGV